MTGLLALCVQDNDVDTKPMSVRLTKQNRDLLEVHGIAYTQSHFEFGRWKHCIQQKKYYLKHYFLERFGGEDVQKLLTAIYYTNLASYIPFYPFMWPFLRMLELSTGDLLTNRSVYDYLEEIGIQDSEFRKILRTSIDSPFYSSYGLARHWTHYLVQGKTVACLENDDETSDDDSFESCDGGPYNHSVMQSSKANKIKFFRYNRYSIIAA